MTDVSLASRKPRVSGARRLTVLTGSCGPGLGPSLWSVTTARQGWPGVAVLTAGGRAHLPMPDVTTPGPWAFHGPGQPGATAHCTLHFCGLRREDGVTTAPPPSGRTQRLRSSVLLTPCYRAEAFSQRWHPGASWAAASVVGCAHVKRPFWDGPPSRLLAGPCDPPVALAAGA